MYDILTESTWAINSGYARRVGPAILGAIENGGNISHLLNRSLELPELAQKRYVSNVKYDTNSNLLVASTSENKKVAIIPIVGTLTKRGDLCAYGMRDYQKMINRANETEGIIGILLDIESPGGTVDGTYELGLTVRASKKPVIAYGDNMVASAAYWIASQTDQIWANGDNPTEFGSIGVLCVHENWGKYIDKNIGSVEIIRAKQSTDKARVNYIEELSKEQRGHIIDDLSQIADDFISIVKSGRGSKLKAGSENIFTGKMYKSKVALELGMIDQIGSFDQVINAFGAQPSLSNKNQMSKITFNKIASLFGIDQKANEQVSEEQESILQVAEERIEKREKFIEELEGKLANAQRKIENLESRINEQQELLDNTPADSVSTAWSSGDRFESNEDQESIKTAFSLDALNQARKYSIKQEK
jgi:protease-4